MARARLVGGVSPYAGKATERLATAEAKVREANAAQREAESRADAADRRAERLEAALERIGERLDAIERGMRQSERPKPKALVQNVASAPASLLGTRDHLHHWTTIADHLGVKPDAARHLAKTQGLPVYKLGKTVASSRVALAAWLDARAASTPTPEN